MPPPVPQRAAAKAAGEKFYFVEKPCRNGHQVKRYTSNGLCSACSIKNVTKWQRKAPWHPARIKAKEQHQLYYSTGKPCPHGHTLRLVSNGVCSDCGVRKSKKWKDRNPEYDHAAMARMRRAKDPSGHRAEVKRWGERNPGKKRAIYAKWRSENRAYVTEYNVVYSRNRRALKAGNGGTHTPDDIKKLHEEQQGRCRACDNNPRVLDVDHIIPIIKGGRGDPSNLQLLCARCNRSKGARNFEEWLADRHGRRSVLDKLFDEAVR